MLHREEDVLMFCYMFFRKDAAGCVVDSCVRIIV